jgi:hypothetical protein
VGRIVLACHPGERKLDAGVLALTGVVRCPAVAMLRRSRGTRREAFGVMLHRVKARALDLLPTENPPTTLSALIEALAPEVREAIHDVDRTLIHLSLQQSPWDRLRSASRMAQTLARIRDAATSQRG